MGRWLGGLGGYAEFEGFAEGVVEGWWYDDINFLVTLYYRWCDGGWGHEGNVWDEIPSNLRSRRRIKFQQRSNMTSTLPFRLRSSYPLSSAYCVLHCYTKFFPTPDLALDHSSKSPYYTILPFTHRDEPVSSIAQSCGSEVGDCAVGTLGTYKNRTREQIIGHYGIYNASTHDKNIHSF